jgi:hypothetical protein
MPVLSIERNQQRRVSLQHCTMQHLFLPLTNQNKKKREKKGNRRGETKEIIVSYDIYEPL